MEFKAIRNVNDMPQTSCKKKDKNKWSQVNRHPMLACFKLYIENSELFENPTLYISTMRALQILDNDNG